MKSIKELRALTGLTQARFAEIYHIPLQTVKQWESSKDSSSYRTPPTYALRLLEQTIFRSIEDEMIFLLVSTESKSKNAKQNELMKAAS
ncbi:helix-turn-helix domain-containing protein [Oribacterium sp. WCC10]|uniref:helix-turn-helix domain-containing protein n=1 Tax=Oribacterium sp. WCC10 TaxID=1855343 RepID=UPI0008DEF13B|nr:helix-turn-helix domain-containing protein [Oribacterium sp. WCC10]SFG56116.1 putative transcriptional regulator [Oribacterium sp. WCC10]